MDTRPRPRPRYWTIFLYLFWDELPKDQDVLHERTGRLQVVAIHE